MRGLIVAAVAAVVTSAGAVLVLTQPVDDTRKITGTVAAAPGLAWSADATAGASARAEFRDPAAGTEFDDGGAGFVAAGDTLVTVVGASDGDTSLRGPMMVGIAADTGAVRWRTPAEHLGGCGRTPVNGKLVCYPAFSDQPALIGYDIASGKVTRTPTNGRMIFALATTDEGVYVAEGDVESDDVRVRAGTLEDPDAHWSRAFAMGTTWDDLPWDALDVSHGQGLFTLGAQIAAFDLGTGEVTWTMDEQGCSRTTPIDGALVVRIARECSDRRDTAADLVDRTGKVVATTEHPVSQDLSIDRPADDTVPVLLADGARDRRTGRLVWTSPDLLTEPNGNAPTGTAIAVLGEVAVLNDAAAHTMTGLNMRTGQRLWRITTDRFHAAETWDGHVLVLSDVTGLWAIDPKSGATVWDIPFRAVRDDPEAFTGGGRLTSHGGGRYTYVGSHTMIGLRPLRH
ncbi:outer membrane protein assembly factor BamB family protein [Nocardia tenerifensis]|nr:PQQ-binding-like beta-propeller repeat protein [Nocardia tenerifensis]